MAFAYVLFKFFLWIPATEKLYSFTKLIQLQSQINIQILKKAAVFLNNQKLCFFTVVTYVFPNRLAAISYILVRLVMHRQCMLDEFVKLVLTSMSALKGPSHIELLSSNVLQSAGQTQLYLLVSSKSIVIDAQNQANAIRNI